MIAAIIFTVAVVLFILFTVGLITDNEALLGLVVALLLVGAGLVVLWGIIYVWLKAFGVMS